MCARTQQANKHATHATRHTCQASASISRFTYTHKLRRAKFRTCFSGRLRFLGDSRRRYLSPDNYAKRHCTHSPSSTEMSRRRAGSSTPITDDSVAMPSMVAAENGAGGSHKERYGGHTRAECSAQLCVPRDVHDIVGRRRRTIYFDECDVNKTTFLLWRSYVCRSSIIF